MSEWLWRGCRRCCCGKWARRRPRASRVVRAARAAWALLTWRLCGEARDGGGELDAQLGIRGMLRLADLLVDSLPGQHLGSCWGEAIFHPEGERDTPGVWRGEPSHPGEVVRGQRARPARDRDLGKRPRAARSLCREDRTRWVYAVAWPSESRQREPLLLPSAKSRRRSSADVQDSQLTLEV